jgi:hypothetical protein
MVQELTGREQFFLNKMNCTFMELDRLREVDPMGKSWGWLLRGIREGWVENLETPDIQKALTDFQALKHSRKFCETYPTDLLKYSDFTALVNALREGEKLKSNKQKAREYEGATLLGAEGDWTLYRAYGGDGALALKILSSGTQWCTAQDEQATNYASRGPVYNVRYLDEPVCQIDPRTGQFHGIDNKAILHANRLMLDGEMGAFILRHADEDLMRHLKNIRFMVAQGCIGPGAEVLNATKRIDELNVEMLMLREAPVHQAVRYINKFITVPDRNLERYLATGDVSSYLVEHYSCNVRTEPWDRKSDTGKSITYILRQRPASLAKYLSKFYDLTTYEFPAEEAGSWFNTTPQVRNIPLITKAENYKHEDGGSLTTQHWAYYSRLTGKHLPEYYRYHIHQSGSGFNDLHNVMGTTIFKALPAMDPELVNELAISVLHRQDHYNYCWRLLAQEPFVSNEVVVNYLIETLKKGYGYLRGDMVTILTNALMAENPAAQEAILEQASKSEGHSIELAARYYPVGEKLDILMEKIMVSDAGYHHYVHHYMVRRTEADLHRNWCKQAVTNIGRNNQGMWDEYLKTAEVEFLLGISGGRHNEVRTIKALLAMESLEKVGVKLEEVVQAIFGANLYVETLSKDQQVIAGILKRKFGWRIPVPHERGNPEGLVRHYYHTGQKEELLEKLDTIKNWQPKEIAGFMTHMKGEWKGTEMARKMVRYKKDIVSLNPAFEAEYYAFWKFVDTGVKTGVRTRNSRLGSLLVEVGAYEAAPAGPLQQVQEQAIANANGDVFGDVNWNGAIHQIQGEIDRVLVNNAAIQAANPEALDLVRAAQMEVAADLIVQWVHVVGEPGVINHQVARAANNHNG